MSGFINAVWDSRELTAAIKERLRFPGRTEAQIVNTAAFWIAANAKAATPFVPVSRINAELNVMVTQRVNKRGRTVTVMGKESRPGGASRSPGVSLAKLIVVASQKAGSNYNVRTNNRYSRVGMRITKGEMPRIIARMISARRSSTHFLKSGWVRAVKELRPFAVSKFRRGSTPPTEGFNEDHGGVPRGTSVPAVAGSWSVTAMIENATGMAGTVNAVNYNQALHTHGAPALQEAIDREAVLMREYSQAHFDEENQKAFSRCLV